jgi:hypothetical protein
MLKKPLLFYSLFCDHSKGVLSYINRKGLKESFLLINVDKYNYNVPSFIVRVPCIYTGTQVIINDDVGLFIDTEAEKLGKDAPINAYYDKEMGNSMSDSFSYIDSEASDIERNFANVENSCSIFGNNVPKEDDFVVNNKISEIESFKSDREKDIANILSSTNNDGIGKAVVR